ncbi:MAG: hypothetical protein OEY19_09730 [Gammaproteobacteria bacterium]|nr:hypothetical protein [Gammaproteobacteria bacterium]MDH5630447.1 hypothetical protein [Gammaproteobacteria bacterium]
MTSNVYETPKSDIRNVSDAGGAEFYIVSPKKFLILFLVTLGMYQIYWFYQHWVQHKQAVGTNVWPVPRAIFSIFFVHGLFELFSLKASERKQGFVWNGGGLAVIFIISSIISNVSDRLSAKEIGSPVTDLIGLVLIPVIAWVLYKAQKVANIACGDPAGELNSELTAANYIWILLGLGLWAMVLLGLYVILIGTPEFLQYM